MSDDWSYVRLKDYCTKIGSGSTPRGGANVYLDSGNVCLIRSQNIYNDGFSENGLVFISNSDAEKLNNVEIELNDVLINITGDSVARVCLAPKDKLPARVNQHVAIIRTVKNELDPKFVRYFLTDNNTQNHLLTLAGTGATRNALTKGMLEEFLVPKPDILIQKKISKILSDLDEKIHLNNQINQTLESIAQAIFKSWFIDFDPVRAKIAAKQEGNDPELAAMCAISGKSEEELQQMPEEDLTELRATAALFPDELVESELGEVPKGWSITKVDDILNRIKIKKRFKKNDVNSFGRTFVLEQGSNVILGFHNEEGSIPASKEEPAFIFGDHTCITKLMLSNFDVSENVIAVTGKKRNSYWTYYAIKDLQKFQEYRRHWMELTSKQVVIADINLTDYFAKKVKILHEDIEYSLRENLVLMNLRNTLLPKLLSGEISVSSFQEDTND